MKNRMVKRLMMTVLTGTICLGCTVIANAAPAGGRFGQNQGQLAEGEMNDSERPEPPQGEMNDGERPEPPQGEMNDAERPEPPQGEMNDADRPEPPQGEMSDAERPELPQGEMNDEDRPEPPQGDRMELPEGAVNIGAYRASLESVEDDDTRTSLQGYVDALEEALNAEREALDAEEELSEEDVASYRDAVTEAQDAMVAAFEEAGVEVSDEMPEMTERDELPAGAAGNQPASDEDNDNGQSVTKRSAMKYDTDTSSAETEANTQNNSFANGLSEVYNWFRNLFR